MQLLREHDITLYEACARHKVTLRPMSERDWPLLYRWNNNADALHYAESSIVTARTMEEVQAIYRGVSQSAFCFIIETDGEPVGECWLQRMNMQQILDRHPGQAVFRIDMMIGEPALWGQGIGTVLIGLLTELAFHGEQADVVYGCSVQSDNMRSIRVFEKNGYVLAFSKETPDGKSECEHYFCISARDYFLRGRIARPDAVFSVRLAELRTGQLTVSEDKLRWVRRWMREDPSLDPLPVLRVGSHFALLDGNSRAVAAYLEGRGDIDVYADDEKWRGILHTTMEWCEREGVFTIRDLAGRVVSAHEHEERWRRRCVMEL